MKPFFPQIASGTYHLHEIGNYVRDVQGWRYQILLEMVEGNQVPMGFQAFNPKQSNMRWPDLLFLVLQVLCEDISRAQRVGQKSSC